MVLGEAVSAYASPEDFDGFARAVEFSADAMVDAYLAAYERVVVANHTQVKLEV